MPRRSMWQGREWRGRRRRRDATNRSLNRVTPHRVRWLKVWLEHAEISEGAPSLARGTPSPLPLRIGLAAPDQRLAAGCRDVVPDRGPNLSRWPLLYSEADQSPIY